MASKNNKLAHPFYIRWPRIIETIYRTYKQNKEFWDKNPQLGPCPISPGPMPLKEELE